eukprot:114396_1
MAELKQPAPENKTDECKDDAKTENIEKQEVIKILFLDIDGVMNGSQDLYQFDNEDDNEDDIEDEALFKTHRVNRLKEILKQTNCKIVLSTAWRREIEGKKQIKKEFTNKGIKWDDVYIGDTPIEDTFHVDVQSDYDMCQRTYEIEKYLKYIESKYIIKSWCAVDDMTLNRGNKDKQIMKGHFVQTDGYAGLTDQDTLKVISILNK